MIKTLTSKVSPGWRTLEVDPAVEEGLVFLRISDLIEGGNRRIIVSRAELLAALAIEDIEEESWT